jgi:hypothetical protein
MYRRSLFHFWVGSLVICLLLCFTTTGRGATKNDTGDDIPDGWRLLPRVGAAIEYGGFIVQQENYTSLLRRRLEIDFLQYRRHIFYLNFDERTYFGTPFDKWDFNLMKYDVILGGYRYDFGNWYLGLFIHHQCNNPIHPKNYNGLIDRERANIYDVGLEFLTKTMRLGMKDRGINFDSPDTFEFLGRFAGGLSGSWVAYKQNIKLDWLAKGQLRFDILRFYSLVPYVEVTGDLAAGPVTRLAPTVEVGMRYHLRNMDITPFFKWGRDQEALTVGLKPELHSFVAKNALLGGARLEALLDAKTFPGSSVTGGLQFFSEIHGMADYGLHLGNSYFNGHGNIELDLEALRWAQWTLFFYTDMNFESRKEDFKPDKINYWMQYGLTYAWKEYFVEGFVKNAQRLDGNFFRGTMERSNLTGLRAGTKTMKPGHYNDGISFTTPPTFQWLNKWNAQGLVGHYFNNRDWQYLWNVNGQVRWDLLRWYFIVPYIQGEVNWMSGGGSTPDALEYAAEPGLRFHGVLDLVVYYRYQYRKNVLYFKGPSEAESLVGVKVLF